MAFAPEAPSRPAASPSLAAAPLAPAAVAAPLVGAGAAVVAHVLALPPGIADTDLSVMPDRYVNEPLPASFRLVLSVRGGPAIASVEPPATITWTEGGLSYRLTSSVRTLSQLVDVAAALR